VVTSMSCGIVVVHWLLADHGLGEIFTGASAMSSNLDAAAIFAIVVGGPICRDWLVASEAFQFPLIDRLICFIIDVNVMVLVGHIERVKSEWPKRAVFIR
jgi:hypothetical protein